MRIKVGDVWYECQPGQPIMVELADKDKINIANMAKDNTKYALFYDNSLTKEQMLEWME